MKRTLKVNAKLLPFLTKPQPIKIVIGGRGSGKSIGLGDLATFKMDTEAADIYCLREFQDSVVDSVHKVLSDSINHRLKLQGWDIQERKIIAPNGARTTYKGANRNPDAMQSAQGYKYSWFEEAHRASQASLDKLLPTIIRNPGAQCWFSANPQSSADPFSKRFINPYQKQLQREGFYEDDLHYIVIVNWRDNPWWNEDQEKLRLWDYEHQTRAWYDWVWEGAFNDSVENAIIKPEWFDAAIDAHIKLGFKPRGIKVVSHDPSDEGPDAKGLSYRYGSVFVDVQEKTGLDVNDGCDWATGYAIENQADVYVWDADGLGAALRRQTLDSITGKKMDHVEFRGSKGVDNPKQVFQPTQSNKRAKTNEETFKNRRAQYYWYLSERFHKTYRAVEKKEYIDPDELISLSSDITNMTALRAEVCRIPRKPNGSGLIQIMSKDEMRIAKIDSPNMADSMMMSLATPSPNKADMKLHFASVYGNP